LLEDFRKQLAGYHDLLVVDHAAIFENIRDKMTDFVTVMRKLESSHMSVFDKVIETLTIGMFEVDCTTVKRELSEYFQTTRQHYLRLLNDDVSNDMKLLRAKCADIMQVLQKVPTTPEELADMLKYIHAFPVEYSPMEEKIRTITRKYQVLEEFCYDISNKEMEEKWDLHVIPQQLQNALFTVRLNLCIICF
jgi:dynein heavy chain